MPKVNIEEFIAKHKLSEKEKAFLTEELVSECSDAFDMFDADKSGEISYEEVGQMFEKLKTELSPDELRLMIQSVDLDKNGEISFEEFIVMMVKAQDPSSEVLEAFAQFDTDNNGFIDAEELKAAMARSGTEITAEEAKQMIANGDLDNDGRISFFEFKEMLEKKKA
mmetsp:Transcript_96254/g.144130  ORF Transcript_96254/g.144130 Transcript_96254/m.144130 type:complete len:167 (-) Transcript_96254:12-512(-)